MFKAFAVLFPLLAIGTLEAVSQFSLSGKIREKYQQTAIAGAQICVGDKVLGISGANGTYSVTLPRGKVEVVYKQAGYLNQAYDLVVNGATTNDADLYRSEADAAYWTTAAISIKLNATAGSAHYTSYADAWSQIDRAALSPEAKAEAARQIMKVLPNPSLAPSSLEDYSAVDFVKIQESSELIHQALSSKDTLQLVDVPGPVAADVAAKQVTILKENNGKVPQNFYPDFTRRFGDSAAERLKSEVKQNRTVGSSPQ